MDTEIRSFDEYWLLYLQERKNPWTRRVQFVATTAAIGCVAGSLLTGQRSLLLGAAAAAFGPAWLSHRFIEKNNPKSSRYLVWKLRADVLLWTQMIQNALAPSLHEPDAAVGIGEKHQSPSKPQRGEESSRSNGRKRTNGHNGASGHNGANGHNGAAGQNEEELDDLDDEDRRRAIASRGWAVWE